jgi:4-amino-4-deoxy-L-arabinose transferase-like glycosyltransferase
LGILSAAALWAVLWVLIPAWSDVTPSGDNIEQLVWSQGLELGYHKHPPLPTWILIGAEHFFPPGLLLTYVLSIAGMLIGAAFLWRLAAELLGRAAALPAVLATGCIAFFSYRAHIYNHNTVLVPFVYASAWFFLKAVRTGRLGFWALFGVACAAAMLTKYQFVVVLGTFLLIALLLRLYRQPRALLGACLAVAVALLLLMPHILWLFGNDFPPFRYAGHMMLTRLGPLQRLDHSAGFALQQVRDVLVAVVVLLLAARLSRRRTSLGESARPFAEPAKQAALGDECVWILALGFAPLAIMLALGLFAGVELENHWGTTALQFTALPALYWMRQRGNTVAAAPLLLVFCTVQVAEAAYVIHDELRDRSLTLDGGRIRAFDPRALAQAAQADWHLVTPAPLRYVVGSTTWGGFIALYASDGPQVLISGQPSASPWVSMTDLARCGGLYIDPIQPPTAMGATELPGGDGVPLRHRGEWDAVNYENSNKGQVLRIRWTVVPPTQQCSGGLSP